MKLTYRGIKYSEQERKLSASTTAIKNKNIIYRGNSPKAKINPQFPLLKYLKQLFDKSGSRPILDPITLWYDHKRQFLEECWHQADVEKLECCWTLTSKIELSKTLKAKPKTQLKYRGITYYR